MNFKNGRSAAPVLLRDSLLAIALESRVGSYYAKICAFLPSAIKRFGEKAQFFGGNYKKLSRIFKKMTRCAEIGRPKLCPLRVPLHTDFIGFSNFFVDDLTNKRKRFNMQSSLTKEALPRNWRLQMKNEIAINLKDFLVRNLKKEVQITIAGSNDFIVGIRSKDGKKLFASVENRNATWIVAFNLIQRATEEIVEIEDVKDAISNHLEKFGI